MLATAASTGVAAEPLPLAFASTHGWLAVYVTSRHEKKIHQQLQLRHIESFLPLYKTVHRWKNRSSTTLELPLFPNYLFVHINARERLPVLQVPGVVSIVCCGREPVRVPQSVIDSLRAALGTRAIEPHPYLVVGHRVRIKGGPLAGLEGLLMRKKENLRVILSVPQIMQSAAVEINGDELEDIGPPARS